MMFSKPDDWIYFSEGGKHAIFTHEDLALRIEKCSLAQAAATADHEASKCHVFELQLSPCSGIWTRIIESVLGNCNVDEAQHVMLPAAFCAQLYKHAISSGYIPSARLKSWHSKEHGSSNDTGEYVKATILRNYTRLKLRLPDNISRAADPITISVEIKPKAGYLTHSPLVLPKHRCKYYRSKYDLQQELMEKGVLRKGWLGETSSIDSKFKRSNYCPLNLFSEDFMRLKVSLAELSKNMQNNFRAWCNGEKLFGEYGNLTTAEYQEVLSKLLGAQHCDGHGSSARSAILETIVHITAMVLHREKFLSNLRSAQQSLDIIDGDGAVLVYQRLIALCGGSQTEAEEDLEQQYKSSDDTIDESLSFTPPPMANCHHLHKLIDEIQQFKSHIDRQKQDGRSVDETIANEYHSSCTDHVQNMSKESCIYLLRKWLLSLTLCDISFFVTFNLLFVKDIDNSEQESLIESNQTVGKAGMFVCEFNDIPIIPKAVVQYEVKVIDCDPKPVTKLRNRENVEKLYEFCEC